jgi:hypothetical protein
MELSIFFAKLLGIYLLVMAADLLLRRHELEGAMKDFASSKGLLVFSGSTSLLLGLALVLGHPVYQFDWQGLITLIGYILILRGVGRIAFPTHLQKNIVSFFHREYWSLFLVVLVLGAFLTYKGFSTTMNWCH